MKLFLKIYDTILLFVGQMLLIANFTLPEPPDWLLPVALGFFASPILIMIWNKVEEDV